MPKETITFASVAQELDNIQLEIKASINRHRDPITVAKEARLRIKRMMSKIDMMPDDNGFGEPDWLAVPQIRSTIKRLANLRQGEEVSPAADIGDWFREADKEYVLRVKVTDVDIAQAVLTRAYSTIQLVPGMEILEVGVNPDRKAKQELATRLRELADEVEGDPS